LGGLEFPGEENKREGLQVVYGGGAALLEGRIQIANSLYVEKKGEELRGERMGEGVGGNQRWGDEAEGAGED